MIQLGVQSALPPRAVFISSLRHGRGPFESKNETPTFRQKGGTPAFQSSVGGHRESKREVPRLALLRVRSVVLPRDDQSRGVLPGRPNGLLHTAAGGR